MFIYIVGFYMLSSIFQYINSQEEGFSIENVYRTLEETQMDQWEGRQTQNIIPNLRNPAKMYC